MRNGTRGFTIVEIVVVLVLLAVLGAICIPKFYNIRESTKVVTGETLTTELQARINAGFADRMRDRKNRPACADARAAAIDEAYKIASEYAADAHELRMIWTGSAASGETSVRADATRAQIQLRQTDGTVLITRWIALPDCSLSY